MGHAEKDLERARTDLELARSQSGTDVSNLKQELRQAIEKMALKQEEQQRVAERLRDVANQKELLETDLEKQKAAMADLKQ